MIIGQDFKIFSFDWIHCIFLLPFLLLSSIDKIFFKSTQSFFYQDESGWDIYGIYFDSQSKKQKKSFCFNRNVQPTTT